MNLLPLMRREAPVQLPENLPQAESIASPQEVGTFDGTFDAVGAHGVTAPHTFQVRILEPIGADEIARTSVKESRPRMSSWWMAIH